jgi:flagellar basal-body rod protein FlgF
LPPYEEIEIAPDGTITILPEGATPDALAIIDRIKMVNPEIDQMTKGDDGLMRMNTGAEADADAFVSLASGALESSNVNVADALVNMIELSRKFEMQVKMMKTSEELDSASASLMRMS